MKQTVLPFTNRKSSALLASALMFIAVFTAYGTEESIESLKKKAQAGDAKAQNKLGEMYGNVRKSAEAGDAQVQFVFGFMFDKGIGVPENDVEAVKWYRKAAEQGHVSAQFALGVMYREGVGIPKNDVEAVKWIRKAAEKELAEAQNILGLMYDEGEGAIYEENIKAVTWIRKAAEQGLPVAQHNLGMMYYNGEGVEEDEVEAYAWFLLAKARGYKGADRIIETLEERWVLRANRIDGQARAAELDQKIPKQ